MKGYENYGQPDILGYPSRLAETRYPPHGSAIPCPNEIPVVARVRLNGANAKDNDIVTAFVNGQPRGYGYVEADTGVANCRFSFRLEKCSTERG